MTNPYSNYIFKATYVLLVILILMGIVGFVVNDNQSITIANSYFSFLVGFGFLDTQPMPKGLQKLKYFLLFFLCFYLPSKIGSLLGLNGITFTYIPYFVVLGFLGLACLLFFLFKNNQKKVKGF